MKKVLTLFVKVFSIFSFLLIISTFTYAQEINELDFLTAGKWSVSSVQIGEQKEDFTQKESWMHFYADGKYEIQMSNDQKEGVWKFDEEEKAVTFEDEEALAAGFKIKKLNDKELLFSATEGDVVYTMTLRR